MEQDMNKNQKNRLAGRFPTFCVVEFDSSTGLSGTGETRNLSTNGVCFTTDVAIEPGVMLRCIIPMQKAGRNMTRLRCEGPVVRANKIEDGWEIAVNFTTFQW
jgi:hypothetical protein